MSTADLLAILEGDVRSEFARAELAPGAVAAPSLPLASVLRHGSPDGAVTDPRIMVVDDESVNVKLVRKYLEAQGYGDFVCTCDSTQAVAMVHEEQPDVVLLDIMMPEVNGLEILETLRQDEKFADLPVIILTADTDPNTKTTALELGATDFLTKPLVFAELTARVRNVLMAKAYQDRIKYFAWELELNSSTSTMDMAALRQEIVCRVARAAEYRYDATGSHVVRVGRYAGILARQMGLAAEQAAMIEEAAPLHNVGLIHVPEVASLTSEDLQGLEFEAVCEETRPAGPVSGAVSADQRRVFRSHPEFGGRIFSGSDSPLLKTAARIALTHHETFGGNGYPLGLAGEDIPIEGRIVAVANVFDGLTRARPRQDGAGPERCYEVIERGRGTHFDPSVLDALLSSRESISDAGMECDA